MQHTKKIFIIAGEASGDLYGAQLATLLHQKNPSLQLFGMGGGKMRAAGVNLIVDANDLAVVGLVDVLKNLTKIRATFQKIKQALIHEQPELIILIDYPGFNLRLAKIAKQLGIKVLYYISPQIWAWRYGRIKHIRRYVDHMAVILPFEAAIYQKEQVPVTFVGHPILNIIQPTLTPAAAKTFFGFQPHAKIIGLMPGSRKSEIHYLLPDMLKAAAILHQHHPDVHFILPLASSLTEDDLTPYLQATKLPITLIKNNNYNAMQICDVIIAASGTATLEITLLGIPVVIVYKVSRLNAYLGRKVIKVKYFGLANLIAGKEITPELLQEDVTPENIAHETENILTDPARHNKIVTDFKSIKQQLSVPAETDIYEVIMQLLNRPTDLNNSH